MNEICWLLPTDADTILTADMLDYLDIIFTAVLFDDLNNERTEV